MEKKLKIVTSLIEETRNRHLLLLLRAITKQVAGPEGVELQAVDSPEVRQGREPGSSTMMRWDELGGGDLAENGLGLGMAIFHIELGPSKCCLIFFQLRGDSCDLTS